MGARDLREIGVRVLGQDPRVARRHVHRDECGLVAPARVEEIERLAVLAEIQKPRAIDLAARTIRKGTQAPLGRRSSSSTLPSLRTGWPAEA